MLLCLCLLCLLLVRFSTGQMRRDQPLAFSPIALPDETDKTQKIPINDPEVTAISTSADDETDEIDATTQNVGTGTDVIHYKLPQLNANNFLPVELANRRKKAQQEEEEEAVQDQEFNLKQKQTEANMEKILKNLSTGMPAGGMLTTK